VDGCSPPEFDEDFRARLHDLFVWRRDVRRFQKTPLPARTLDHLIEEACLAPSVGFSQPWRFVVVEDLQRRREIVANFFESNAEALESYKDERRAQYARLKLAGLREAPAHLAVFVDEATPGGHGLGRRTMPETLRYSAVAAVCHLWLAARAAGIGTGWVSILDPGRVAETLETPPGWSLVAYLCLGYPQQVSQEPELEALEWERRRSVESLVLRR
jgi:5,6-dimethylbenzimidazole synthase